MTPAEFALMKVLWVLASGSVAEVRAEHRRRYGGELAYTTVMTLLGRLASKGAVHVDKSRQPFVYRPALRRESVLRDRLRRFIDTVFDGDSDSLMLHLVADESLSADDLQRMEAQLGAGDEKTDDGEGGDS